MARSWASRHPRASYYLTGATPRILRHAAQIIDRPSRYTNVTDALSVTGVPTAPACRTAVSWSAAGAIYRAARNLKLSADARYFAMSQLEDCAARAALPKDFSSWTFDQAHQGLLFALEYNNFLGTSDVLRWVKSIIACCRDDNGSFHAYLRSRYPDQCWNEPSGFDIYRLIGEACYDLCGEQDDDHYACVALDRAARDMGYDSVDRLYDARGESGLMAALDWAIAFGRFRELYGQPDTQQ